MKRFILAATTMFLLTAAAAMAQNPLNTTAPGPSQETKPNQTNNDFPNPGHPLPAPGVAQPKPVTENGTVEGTATESMQRDQAATAPTATTDTTATTTTGSTTDSSYGTTNGTVDSTATGTTGTSSSLPKTGSDMPLIALFGLASLAGALALRASRLSA
jgi:LPXTG-motif cell wall-anchored protein